MTRFFPYAILLAEVLAFYRKVLFHPAKFVIPWDFRYYHLPLSDFVAKSFAAGRLPLWDPYTYCGWPIYAELTSQVFYPPAIVAALLAHAVHGHTLYFMERQLVAHVLLAGVFAYLLLKRLGVGRCAALLGATVYQLGPFFASQAQHLGAIDAAAWLPLSWLAIVEIAGRFSWRWFAVLSLSFAMSLLAGFPALTFVTFASSFLIAALLLSWRGFAATAVACVWSIALAGIQILPTIELSRLSIAKHRADWLGAGGGLPVESLVSLVSPNHWNIFEFDSKVYRLPWNPSFLYLYFGLIGLACCFAAAAAWRKRYTAQIAILAVVCLCWMLGEHTPIWRAIFGWLPAAIKGPIYAEFALSAFTLAMAVLAGIGAQRIFENRPAWFRCAAVAACAIELILVSSGRAFNTSAVAIEPGITYERWAGSLEIPARMRKLVNQTIPPSRIDTMKGAVQWVNAAPLLEVPTASGDDPMALERLIEVRRLFSEGERWQRFCQIAVLDSPLVGLLNIRYVLSYAPLDEPLVAKSGFREIDATPANILYENSRWQARFFLVNRVRNVAGMPEALSAMRSPQFDPSSEAVVEGLPTSSLVNNPQAVQLPSVRVTQYEPQSIRLETDSPIPAYLVTSEAAYPGWRATMDGVPQPLYMTNGALRGLPTPPGRHIIEMRFAPSILTFGAILTLISSLALAALSFRDWSSRRRSNPPLTSSTS